MLVVATFLKEVPGKGIGLFAKDDMPPETVWHIDETYFDKVYPAKLVQDKGLTDFFAKYAEYNASENSYYLCVDNARFVNHSESPNTYYDIAAKCCKTSRHIKAGEEITCDYRATCDDANLGLNFSVID